MPANSNRGFAAMDPARQRQIASLGGRASHKLGTGHEFTSEEAAAAGRKGGQARAMNRAKANGANGDQQGGMPSAEAAQESMQMESANS
jgi:general stress protein YciG